MSRKLRRAALKNDRLSAILSASADRASEVDDLVREADLLHQQRQFAYARDICRKIVAREPHHVAGNNLMGLVLQALGRDRNAIGYFTKAIAVEESDALLHYNIAYSYQRLNSWDDAVRHFTRAIALNMGGRPIEDFIERCPVVASCLNVITQQWPRRLAIDSLFGDAGVSAAADDAFLRCALEKTVICSAALETFLVSVRFALLKLATTTAPEFGDVEANVLGFYAALAQQSFINEYVLDQSDDETRQAENLRVILLEKLAADAAIPPLLLITVAAYFPLHRLPAALSLSKRDWPPVVNGLLRQQLFEPLEEVSLRSTIPSLTIPNDEVSIKVQQQYEENPYPRWTTVPDVSTVSDWHTRFAPGQDDSGDTGRMEILVAGCGTGQNPIQTALKFPAAHVLAVDLSSVSLAYAIRKTREAGIQNIDYAQADILQLGSMGRSFDRIGAVGILHHLAEPKVGWRVLLSLLRPGGIMDVGLYSRTARRAVVAGRALIAARGFRATIEDIRLLRRELRLTNPSFAKDLVTSPDFHTTSGCRDLLFHVIEHRFDILEISAFLSENGMTFLGFRLQPHVSEQFRKNFPDPNASTNLDFWHAFEEANPQTFASMYRFAIRKKQ